MGEKFIVWEFDLEPGERTPINPLELRCVFYVISATSLEVFDVNDKFLTTFDLNDGDVIPLRLEGDELVVVRNESLQVPVTHFVRNAASAK